MIDKEALYKAREDTKNEILEKLKTCDRFGVVRPQGFGKTYIITELCKELPGKKLIIEPTNGINEYIKKLDLSKETSVITYQRLLHKDFNHKSLLDYDYIFLDEMHRSLAIKWGKVLKEILNDFKGKVIGFSATPLRGDGKNPINELFNNEQISEMTLVEAIIKEYLPQPTYVTGIYELNNKIIKNEALQKQLKDYNIDNNLEFIFKKYLPSDKDNLHILVFCYKIEDIDKMKKNMKRWLNIYPIKEFEIHSKYKDSLNNETMQKFIDSNAKVNVLYSINMLNEGIHLNKLDAIIFLRNTRSTIIYYQQLGRIISEHINGALVFDLVNNVYSIKSGYLKDLEKYANVKSYKDIKTISGESIKVYEEQQDLVELLNKHRRQRHVLTNEQEKYIIDNCSIKSLTQIAKDIGIPDYKVEEFVKLHKLKIKYNIKHFTEEDKNFIEKNASKMTVCELATKLNRSTGSIKSYLKGHNIKCEYERATRMTEEEINYIKNNYLFMNWAQLAKTMHRDITTIYRIKRQLNLKTKGRLLSEEEKEFIKNNYTTMNDVQIAKHLERNVRAIWHFRHRHNLISKYNLTVEEKEFIKNNYEKLSISQISKKLNRTEQTIKRWVDRFNQEVDNVRNNKS